MSHTVDATHSRRRGLYVHACHSAVWTPQTRISASLNSSFSMHTSKPRSSFSCGSNPRKEAHMTTMSARRSDGALAQTAAAARVHEAHKTSAFKFVPGFLYIIGLYVVGKFMFADPRATLVQWGEYQLSWVEVLMVGAAMMAMTEQMRVSHPGIDNTVEAILMAAVAAVQVLLFALGAAGVRPLSIFNNTEFLMLTVISMTQAVVAILINARTLRRTIGVGDNA